MLASCVRLALKPLILTQNPKLIASASDILWAFERSAKPELEAHDTKVAQRTIRARRLMRRASFMVE